jgi:hypothetical protein
MVRYLLVEIVTTQFIYIKPAVIMYKSGRYGSARLDGWSVHLFRQNVGLLRGKGEEEKRRCI